MIQFRRYLPFFIIPASVALALVFASCSSSTSASSDGTVQMQSQLSSKSTQLPYTTKNPAPQSLIAAVTVTQVEVFIKDIKLHPEDSAGKEEHEIKTGPAVVVFDSVGAHVFSTATVPAGTYEKIKFELHHPDDHQADDHALLVQYPDFMSGNKTFTIVMRGYTTSLTGDTVHFIARSEKSHNYEIKFKDKDNNDQNNIVINGGATTLLTLAFDPKIAFHLSGGTGILFDPSNSIYQNDIDNNVVLSLRIVKN